MIPPVPPYIQDDEDGAEDDHADQRLVRIFHNEFLVLPDEVTDPGEDGDPYPAPRRV